jgi:hypothetical protein
MLLVVIVAAVDATRCWSNRCPSGGRETLRRLLVAKDSFSIIIEAWRLWGKHRIVHVSMLIEELRRYKYIQRWAAAETSCKRASADGQGYQVEPALLRQWRYPRKSTDSEQIRIQQPDHSKRQMCQLESERTEELRPCGFRWRHGHSHNCRD